ncbi:SprT family zinc-dependent metalloprotease [Ruminococcus sp. Marseille-P6503]|uniref:M48 family metallopeptidase n=1 Tax=Ruminococcus sp. Marseille-P6503 TaxID=2364796 RepID=UPI0013DDD213|nr:SprT family zinc-dependent metalloprotease [Ruminococcus sp. Marseille-P6503]
MGQLQERTVTLENGQRLSYTLDRGKRKNLYICIKEGRVLVKLPEHCEAARAEEFLRLKSGWIIKNLQKPRTLDAGFTGFGEGDSIFLAGRRFFISLVRSDRYFKPFFENDTLKISVNNGYTEDYVKAQAERAAEEKATEIILERVGYLTSATGLYPASVCVKRLKSSWGRCSSDRKISINLNTAYLDMECIDYVIIHELCHLVHMNHSRDFWNLVGRYCPEWKRIREKMRK